METTFKVEPQQQFFQGIFFVDGERELATILSRTVEEAMVMFEKCKSAIINGTYASGKYGTTYVAILCEGDPMNAVYVGSVEGSGSTEVDDKIERLKFAIKKHIVKESQMREDGTIFS